MKKTAAIVGSVVAAAAGIGLATVDLRDCVMRLPWMPRGFCSRMVDGKLVDPERNVPFLASEASGACQPVVCKTGELLPRAKDGGW